MSKILKNVFVLFILVLFTTGSAFAGGGGGVTCERCLTHKESYACDYGNDCNSQSWKDQKVKIYHNGKECSEPYNTYIDWDACPDDTVELINKCCY